MPTLPRDIKRDVFELCSQIRRAAEALAILRQEHRAYAEECGGPMSPSHRDFLNQSTRLLQDQCTMLLRPIIDELLKDDHHSEAQMVEHAIAYVETTVGLRVM